MVPSPAPKGRSPRYPATLPFTAGVAIGEELFGAAVLPEQFADPPGGSGANRGVLALMQAVLEDAILCLRHQDKASRPRARRLAREAAEWLCSDDEAWPFSYRNVCAALGIEPDYLRRRLLVWRRQHPAPRRKHMRPVVVTKRLRLAA
jgi:hypothetical protein